jgi:hypothetical protein
LNFETRTLNCRKAVNFEPALKPGGQALTLLFFAPTGRRGATGAAMPLSASRNPWERSCFNSSAPLEQFTLACSPSRGGQSCPPRTHSLQSSVNCYRGGGISRGARRISRTHTARQTRAPYTRSIRRSFVGPRISFAPPGRNVKKGPGPFSVIRFPRVPRRVHEGPRRSTRGYNPPPRWGSNDVRQPPRAGGRDGLTLAGRL